MNKKKIKRTTTVKLLTLFVVVALLFLNGQAAFAVDFKLIFSNDIRGEIEPCG